MFELNSGAFTDIERVWKVKLMDWFEAISRHSGICIETVGKVTKPLRQYSQFTSRGL